MQNNGIEKERRGSETIEKHKDAKTKNIWKLERMNKKENNRSEYKEKERKNNE